MSVRMRHQLVDGRVLITAAGEYPTVVHVSPAEAKRFAWAILSDLEPDEAFHAGAPNGGDATSLEPRAPGKRAPWGSQARAIIGALVSGHKDTRRIAEAAATSTHQAAVQLSKLKSAGVVAIVEPGRAGQPAVWGLNREAYGPWLAKRGWSAV